MKRDVNNVVEIVKTCRWGYPVVVKTLPFRSDNGVTQPFANLFWLICPQLDKYMSALENEGWIKRFEKMIEQDSDLRKRMKSAHMKTIEMRRDLAERYSLQYFASILGKRGIGGITDYTKLKCLHLHVANYLGGIDNPIGKMALDMVDKKWECKKNMIKCIKKGGI